MDAPIDNPKLDLPPEMILGLLKELAGSDCPIVRDFHNILRQHPVSIAEKASTSEVSSSTIEPPAIRNTSGKNDVRPSGDASGLSGDKCCRNGIKRTRFSAPRGKTVVSEVSTDRATRSTTTRVKEVEEIIEEETGKRTRFGALRGKTVVNEVSTDRATRTTTTQVKEVEEIIEEETGDKMQGIEFTGVAEVSKEVADSAAEDAGTKRKRSGKDKQRKMAKKNLPPTWLTDGSPPELFEGTDELMIRLCHVVSNTGLQSLTDLTQQLIHPESRELGNEDNLSLTSLIRACSREDVMQTVTDFRHMILLVRMAFRLQKCVCSVTSSQSGFVLSISFSELTSKSEDKTHASFASIAAAHRVNEKSLWNWYNMGSRLIHIAAGGEYLSLKVCIQLKMNAPQEPSIHCL